MWQVSVAGRGGCVRWPTGVNGAALGLKQLFDGGADRPSMRQTNSVYAVASEIDVPESRSGIVARRIRLEDESAGKAVSPIWAPVTARRDTSITTDEVLSRTRPPEPLPPEIEGAILHSIRRPLAAGESHQNGNANRERELRSIFMTLDAIQSLQLRRRLDLDKDCDQIAVAFRRLVVERRQRLRAVLVRQCVIASTRCR